MPHNAHDTEEPKITKEECERFIEQTATALFRSEVGTTEYESERLKLIGYCYLYLVTENKKRFEDYGLEITELVSRLIRNYDTEKGFFLHFFNGARRNEYPHWVAKRRLKQAAQLHLTDADKRLISHFYTCNKRLGIDITALDYEDQIRNSGFFTEEEVNKLLELIPLLRLKPLDSPVASDSEGNVVTLGDIFDSGKRTDDRSVMVDNCKELIDLYEAVYNSFQDRQKPLLRVLITTNLFSEKGLEYWEIPEVTSYIETKSFFDRDTFKKTIKLGERIPYKDIAVQHGVEAAHVSRAWKGFVTKAGNALDKNTTD